MVSKSNMSSAKAFEVIHKDVCDLDNTNNWEKTEWKKRYNLSMHAVVVMLPLTRHLSV